MIQYTLAYYGKEHRLINSLSTNSVYFACGITSIVSLKISSVNCCVDILLVSTGHVIVWAHLSKNSSYYLAMLRSDCDISATRLVDFRALT